MRPIRRFRAPLAGLVAAHVVLIAAAVRATSDPVLPVKLAPVALTVQADGASPEQISELASQCWSLFDRDTRATLPISRAFTLIVDVGATTPIETLKVRGNDRVRLSVDREDGNGGWATIPTWNALDLSALRSDRWNAISAGGQVTVRRLAFRFSPRNTQNPVVGFSEIELWGVRDRSRATTLSAISAEARAGTLAYPFSTVAPDRAELDVFEPTQVRFELFRDPRTIRRAFLVFDLQGGTSGIALARSWNGLPRRGGFQKDAITAGEWVQTIEELDPTWLKNGRNTLDLRPTEERKLRLRKLALVIEVETGRNDVESMRGGADELAILRDGDLATTWTAGPELRVDFSRVVELDSFTVSVPFARRGTAYWEARVGEEWVSVPTSGAINTGAWTPGANTVAASEPITASGMRLRFELTEPGLALAELSIATSAVGARWGIPKIQVRAPERGEYWDDESYIWGWVSPALLDGQPSQITIAGRTLPKDADGAFARSVYRSEASNGRFGDGPWEIEVKAALPNGTTLTRFVSFTENRLGTSAGGDSAGPSVGESDPPEHGGSGGGGDHGNGGTRRASRTLRPHEGGDVQVGRCKVSVPPWALSQETEITVEALEEADLAGLGPALVNVTAPYAGCRFLPHGRFDKPVKIEVPFDRNELAGGSIDEVASFYYDTDVRQWLPLKRLHVNKGLDVVVSETDHFTDVIDGILQLPDHPTPLSYNPNSIKDIKAASPTANIDFIEPPSANNHGSANVGFGIRVPPGRAGAEPSLAVRYSSPSGNGPMGLGWNLGVSSISIDTRFGVPRYTGDELYTLDGSQLERIGRTNRYRQRIEGAFLRIERHGVTPADFWWEVTSKDNSKAIYGKRVDARLASYRNGSVFTWHLEKTTDPNGNTIDYTYLQDLQPAGLSKGNPLGGERWVAAYLQEVRYSGHVSGETGRYTVRFDYDTTRDDLVIDGRAGFKTLTRRRLKTATVRFDQSLVRQYQFTYDIGRHTFHRSLLASVAVKGADGSEFYRHSFEYFARPEEEFDEVKTIGELPEGRALSSSENKFEGKSLYLGFSVVSPSRSGSTGLRVGHEISRETGLSGYFDVSGDGLPDLVLGRDVYLNDGTGFRHVDAPSIGGELDVTRSESLSVGVSAGVASVGFGANYSQSKSKADKIFADFDGDGFVDFANQGRFFRNDPNRTTGAPRFAEDAGGIQNPGAFAVADPGAQAEMDKRFFRVDPVVQWIAPFAGEVIVAGGASRIDTPVTPSGQNVLALAATGSPGQDPSVELPSIFRRSEIEVSIWEEANLRWSAILTPESPTSGEPGADGDVLRLNVSAGERLYFRVHAKAGDVRGMEVAWSPAVVYSCVGSGGCEPMPGPYSLLEPSGRSQFIYDRKGDFSLQGRTAEFFAPPEKGSLEITGTIVKRPTTHPVTVRVWRGVHDRIDEVVHQWTFAPSQSVDAQVAKTIAVEPREVEDSEGNPVREILAFEILSRGDVAEGAATFRPTLRYTSVCRADLSTSQEVCGAVPAEEQANLTTTLEAGRPVPQWKPQVPSRSVRLPKKGRVRVHGKVELRSTTGGPADFLLLGVNLRHHAQRLGLPAPIVGSGGSAPVTVDVSLDREIAVLPGDLLFLRAEGIGDTHVGASGTVKVEYVEECTRNEAGEEVCEEVEDDDPQRLPVQGFFAAEEPKGHPLGGVHAWWVAGWNGNRTPFTPDFFYEEPEADENDVQPWAITARRSLEAAEAWTVADSGRIEKDRLVPGRAGAASDGWFDAPDALRIGHSRSFGLTFEAVDVFNGGISYTESHSSLDTFDFNGDRVPDQVRGEKVRLLGPTGESAGSVDLPDFGESAVFGPHPVRRSHGISLSMGLGSSTPDQPRSKVSGRPDAPDHPAPNDRAAFVLSGGVGVSYGMNVTTWDWTDVNGDSLPDALHRVPRTGHVVVRLNLGYRLGDPEEWNAPFFPEDTSLDTLQEPIAAASVGGAVAGDLIQIASNSVAASTLRSDNTLSANVSAGFGSPPGTGLSGGVNVAATFSANRTVVDMIDVHGDGMVDLVMKRPTEPFLRVKPNLGRAWGEEERWPIPTEWGFNVDSFFESLANNVGFENASWPSGISDSEFFEVESLRYAGAMSVTYTGYLNYTFLVSPPPVPVFFHVAPSFMKGRSVHNMEISLQDVDGDGAPDYAFKAHESLFGTGGQPVIRYKRNKVGPTNLLKRVIRPLGGSFALEYERARHTIDNPLAQWTLAEVELEDGFGETYKTAFAYGEGKYDRVEREFLGFGAVLTRDSVGREVEQRFATTYHQQGLLLSSTVRGEPAGNPLVEIPRAIVANEQLPRWTRTEHTYENRVLIDRPGILEGSVFPQHTRTVTKFFEGGQGEKSLVEEFTYDLVGNLATYVERGGAGDADDVRATVQYLSSSDSGPYLAGLPTRIVVTNSGGALLRERLAVYDGAGNLQTLTSTVAGGVSPASHMTWDKYGNLKRFVDPVGYAIDYAHDGDTHTYVTAIQDSFGYRSSASYDLKFGLPILNTDINHERTAYEYDPFGRTTKVFGPKEMGGPTSAFSMSYFLGAFPPGFPPSRPHALTKNKEDNQGAGTLDTLTVVDGLGRVVQVHSEAEVAQGNSKAYGVIVSGKVRYDGAGRVTSQEQPAFVAGFPGAFVSATGGRATRFFFDPLDRTTKVILPDGAVTRTEYSFGEGLHRTLVIDAEGRRRASLADVRGNVTAIDEFLSGASIRTHYRYSALSELLAVRDANGNTTSIAYDTLGRRTFFQNPDRGRIDYTYDPAGNLLSLVDDNLRASSEAIEYRYDFSRLKEVVYPRSPRVLYEYGAPNAPHRRAGRIAKITDESGFEERFYGKLGELEKSVRTINTLKGQDQPSSGTYATEWTYDSFGRMREITYPDGEVLTYAYDRGGRVVSATGKKQGQVFEYLRDVAYDEFGSRVKLELGNGVTTSYAYDPNRRWLTFLRTVNPEGEVLQALSYTFDRVGNITKLVDSGVFPGEQHFSYDTLDRLTNAQGTAKLKNGSESRYQNAFGYDRIHNLLQKVQLHDVETNGGAINPQAETTYTLNFAYAGPKPHALTTDGEKNYQHDANGNLLGWQHLSNGTRREIAWNEENRITQIADNGRTTRFLYDAGGQRVVKEGQYGEVATVNAFFTARDANVFTKHVFVGDTRIASHVVGKKGDTGETTAALGGTLLASADGGAPVPRSRPGQGNNSGNGNGRGIENAGSNAGGNGQGSGNAHGNNPHGNGVDPCNRGQGKKVGLNCDGVSPGPGQPPGSGGSGPRVGGHERKVFFFHSDQLGSTSWLTDPTGEQFQRLAYFPFGETWIEEGTDSIENGAAFRFTGKELDPETALYYFGTRYYDARVQVWTSADPALLTTPFGLSAFAYSSWSPIRRLDPDGNADLGDVWENLWNGDIGLAQKNLSLWWNGTRKEDVARVQSAVSQTLATNPVTFYSHGSVPANPSEVVQRMEASVRESKARGAGEIETGLRGMVPVAKYYASLAAPELAMGAVGSGVGAVDDALALQKGYSAAVVGGGRMTRVFHGTTRNASFRIHEGGFRYSGGVYFAESDDVAQYFALDAVVRRGARRGTIIQLDVPDDLARRLLHRGVIGEANDLPFVDMGSGYERILTTPGTTREFNDAIRSGAIRMRYIELHDK